MLLSHKLRKLFMGLTCSFILLSNTSNCTAATTPLPAADFSAFMDHIEKQWSKARHKVDRNMIVYQRMAHPNWQLEFKSLGTSNTVAVTGAGWFTGLPRVSDDGSTFYFITNEPRGGGDERYIIALPLNGKPRIHAVVPRLASFFDISPDGQHIAFGQKAKGASITHVHILNVRSGEVSQFSADGVGGLHPSWSPDGSHIAYVANRKLRVKNVANGEEQIIVYDDLLKELPTWSPDGKTIAYQATAQDEWGYEIYSVDVSSGEISQLTYSRGVDANPVFTADGQAIIFTSERDENRNNPTLHIMSRNGAAVHRDVTAGPDIFLPNISLSAVVLDKPELVYVPVEKLPTPTQPADQPAQAVVQAAVPTPVDADSTPQPADGLPVAYDIEQLMTSLESRQADTDRALDGNHIFYQVRTVTGVILQAKVPGTTGAADTIDIAALPHSSLSRPDISADRTSLFFKFIDQSQRGTYIIHLSRGQAPRVLEKLPLIPDLAIQNFNVTEDASKIIFDVRVDEQFSIFSYDIADRSVVPLIPIDQGSMYPALSPDDSQLAFISAGRIQLLDFATGNQSTLVEDSLLKEHPAWSPDGQQIVYHASDMTETGFDIYMADTSTSTPSAIVTAPGDDLTPTFAPGTQSIIYTNDADTPGYARLHKISLDGSNNHAPENISTTDILNVR